MASDTKTQPGAAAPTTMRSIFQSPLASSYLVMFAVAVLIAVGSLMVLSSSSIWAQYAGDSPYYYSIRQLFFLVVGLIGMFVVSRLPTDFIRRLGWLGWIIAVVLLLLLFVPGMGKTINGNLNWLQLGPIRFQPSEFAKLAIIIWSATVLHNARNRLHEPRYLFLPLVPCVAVPLVLVMLTKDLGTALIMGFIVMAMLYFCGTPLRWLTLATGLGAAVVALFTFGSANRMSRIEIFLNPESNPDLASQPMAALYALASGGWWGLGLGASKQKWGGLKNAAHTDFIFAVIGEELGLFGVVLIVAMFALLAWAGFSIALQSDKMFNRLVCAGIIAWFAWQATVNILVVMNLLPVLGVPLPFISYGGTALLSNLLAVGVLLACGRDTPAARRELARRKKGSTPRMTSVLATGQSR